MADRRNAGDRGERPVMHQTGSVRTGSSRCTNPGYHNDALILVGDWQSARLQLPCAPINPACRDRRGNDQGATASGVGCASCRFSPRDGLVDAVLGSAASWRRAARQCGHRVRGPGPSSWAPLSAPVVPPVCLTGHRVVRAPALAISALTVPRVGAIVPAHPPDPRIGDCRVPARENPVRE